MHCVPPEKVVLTSSAINFMAAVPTAHVSLVLYPHVRGILLHHIDWLSWSPFDNPAFLRLKTRTATQICSYHCEQDACILGLHLGVPMYHFILTLTLISHKTDK